MEFILKIGFFFSLLIPPTNGIYIYIVENKEVTLAGYKDRVWLYICVFGCKLSVYLEAIKDSQKIEGAIYNDKTT